MGRGQKKRIGGNHRMRKQELTEDEIYMKEALRQARKAYALMEVPIGCVIVYEGKIIARGYNLSLIHI